MRKQTGFSGSAPGSAMGTLEHLVTLEVTAMVWASFVTPCFVSPTISNRDASSQCSDMVCKCHISAHLVRMANSFGSYDVQPKAGFLLAIHYKRCGFSKLRLPQLWHRPTLCTHYPARPCHVTLMRLGIEGESSTSIKLMFLAVPWIKFPHLWARSLMSSASIHEFIAG